MTYHRGCNEFNTTGVTSVEVTAHPSGAPEFTPVFSGVAVTRSFALCVCFVNSCFLLPLTIMLSVLRYTDSDIFKLFLLQACQSRWRHPRHNLNKHLETGRRETKQNPQHRKDE